MTINVVDFDNSVSANDLRAERSNKSMSKNAAFSDILDTKLTTDSNDNYDLIFKRAGDRYNVPVNLLKSVAKAESGFNAKAVSWAGAQGVMQLMPGTARGLGVSDPFDPEQNIMGGAKYLRQMLDKFDGNVELSLAAYNAGPGNVIKFEGIPPFTETRNYVKKVMGYCGDKVSFNSNEDRPYSVKKSNDTYSKESYGLSNYFKSGGVLQTLANTDSKGSVDLNDIDNEKLQLIIKLYRCDAEMRLLSNDMNLEII